MKLKIAVLIVAIVLLAFGQRSIAGTVPQGFPFAACPGGEIIESFAQPNVSQIVEYKTSQSARQISEFYTQDLKSKGWTLVSGGMQTPDYSVLRATKGKDKVVFHIGVNGRPPLVHARIVLLFNSSFD